jgi:hypothetical protein
LRLSHVWVLDYFATELRHAAIVISFENDDGVFRWKRTWADIAILIVALSITVVLLIDEHPTAAFAILLQFGFTLRNNFEGLLVRPVIKLPFSSGTLTVLEEKTLKETVLEFLGPDAVFSPRDFTRKKLIERLLEKTNDSTLLLSEEGERGDTPLPRIKLLNNSKPTFQWLQAVSETMRKLNLKRCGACCHFTSEQEYLDEFGEILLGLETEVYGPYMYCVQIISYLQNGQLILYAAFLMGYAMSLSTAVLEADTTA